MSPEESGPSQPIPRRRPSLLIGNQDSPSLAFLHKPSRSNSGNETKEYRKLMEQNTEKNKMRQLEKMEVLSPSLSSTTDLEDVHISHSPSAQNFPLVRKKSGEFVRSSLKSHSRSLSLPSTPSYKQVHFGEDPSGDAEVKYFDQKDTPQAISNDSSPTRQRDYFTFNSRVDDVYSLYSESAIEDDDNFSSKGSLDSYDTRLLLRGEWKLSLLNFPKVSYPAMFKESKEVFLERIYIGDDKDNLLGEIAVKNLSYHKQVILRYSLDGWRSVTEIDCRYLPNPTVKLRRNNYDRFGFEIPLVTLFHNTEETSHTGYTDVSSKFSLCIKYTVLGNDYWDNNSFDNFNVVLHKITRDRRDLHRIDTSYPKSIRHSSKYLDQKKKDHDETKRSENVVPSQHVLSQYADVADFDMYYPNSPETHKIAHTPYSPIELNPRNKAVFDNEELEDLDMVVGPSRNSEVSPLTSTQNWKASADPNSPNELTGLPPHRSIPSFFSSERPATSSAEYRELLDRFCFYGSDSAKENDKNSIRDSPLNTRPNVNNRGRFGLYYSSSDPNASLKNLEKASSFSSPFLFDKKDFVDERLGSTADSNVDIKMNLDNEQSSSMT